MSLRTKPAGLFSMFLGANIAIDGKRDLSDIKTAKVEYCAPVKPDIMENFSSINTFRKNIYRFAGVECLYIDMRNLTMPGSNGCKRFICVWVALLIACVLVPGCTKNDSGAVQTLNNRWKLTVEPVLETDHEQLWKLTLRSDRPTWYALQRRDGKGGRGAAASQVWARGESGAYTASAWLVFSKVRISISGEVEGYLKTMLIAGGGITTSTRRVDANLRLENLVTRKLLGETEALEFDKPVVVSQFNDRRIQLIVGEHARDWDSEQSTSQDGGGTASSRL